MSKASSCVLSLLVLATLLFVPVAWADGMPANLQVGEQQLQLNGEGLRKKLFIKLYRMGLYLGQNQKSVENVVFSDEVMAIKLQVISSLITQEKMVAAIREGFAKNPTNSTPEMQQNINQFIAVFGAGVSEGDSFSFVYQPGQGTQIYKGGDILETIENKDFKAALFGIWLGQNPVQESLKKALLGGG